jgi:hypothetical protein
MGRPRKKAPVVKNYAKDIQDTYVQRISECQTVLDHLERCPAWEVIHRDISEQRKFIDDNWWKIKAGSPDLEEFRITALAYNHLLDLTNKYQMDLDNAKKELDKLQNTDTKIVKDFDPN